MGVPERDRLPALADASAVFGAAGWLAVVLAGVFGPIRDIVALAMLVLVPLALRLADTPRRDGTRSGWYRAAVVGQPVAAVAGVVSLTLPAGTTATLVAVPWALATVLVAGFGAWRLLGRGPWPVEELAVDAGLLYIVVGGVALLFDRSGTALVFEPLIVTLTIVHFHYAGSALPVLAGLAGRDAPGGYRGRLLRATTGIVVIGPGIIGIGITAAALDLPFAAVVEFAGVAAFTVAVAVFSLSVLVGVVPRRENGAQRLLLGVASVAVTVSMGFAVLYGLARATGGTYLGINAASFDLMVTYHGQLNAYAFALPALVGWRLAIPGTRSRQPGVAFSRLHGGWRIGPEFLDRRGMTTDAAVTGMVTTVDEYARAGFDPDAVAPAVTRFYEHSGSYELSVDPAWDTPWRTLAALYRPLAVRVGQLSVPRQAIGGDAVLRGRVVGVDTGEGRADQRAWIRSNADRVDDARRMTYVGVYDRSVADDTAFLRVAFPLPGGNLTGLLRLENGGSDGDGLVLSSFPTPGNADDAGLYLVVGGVGLRLPLNERLVVVPDGDGVHATHRVEALGLRLFTLTYGIQPTDESLMLGPTAQ
ncbi:YndJ family protein [Haloarcula halophila]|uniref:YndJ family protein n=1 Tax=Haloarcula TaxID=2237 RepID=UPI0023E38D43|nr:YndJ family protein [Halomicroarcula sp. DFY41]